MPYTGQPLKRFEDPKLVTGQGSFVDDIQLPDMLHAAIVRSSHAHARLRAIDVARARNMVGVVAVLTGSDIAGVLGDVPTRAMSGGWEVDEMHPVEQPVLARDKVCYVGQPIAIVVAQNRYLAKDAVALIQVDYEPLPPVLDPLVALQAEATPIHAALGTNVGLRVSHEGGDVAAPVAVTNAIMDALSSVGVCHIDTPLTAEKIWRALHGGGEG